MLAQFEIEGIARELVTAGRTRTPVPRLTARYPGMTVEDAYAVQSFWAKQLTDEGKKIVGRKIGLTSKPMQAATGITEPDYGVLFEHMVLANGCTAAWADYTHPRVEVELAFHLASDLTGPGVTVFDVVRATEYVVPALEILDSRIEMEGRTIVDTISDNAACGAIVVGGTPAPLASVDLRWSGAILYRNEAVEETGLAAAVLDNPAAGVAWLANKLSRHSVPLRAGELILAGSFIRPVWVQAGDTFHADYGRLGTVTCHFT